MPDFGDQSGQNSEEAEPAGCAPDLAIDGAEAIDAPPNGNFPVVGIGASAGGLDAVTQILKALPPNSGMAFVVVQHLDPNHESMLVSLLAGHTEMAVLQAKQGTEVKPDRVYVIPPNTQMKIRRGLLELTARTHDGTRNLPIDYFLTSLAEDQRSRAIGVILSGAASDGTLGLEAIKTVGGITFAQDETAKFDGMPRSAIAAGVVDFVLPPDRIAEELAGIAQHSYFGSSGPKPEPDRTPTFDKILSLLRFRTGVDFTLYRMATIRRRLARRMAMQHIESQEEYLSLLDRRPSEVDALFDDLLITVTDFFRDPETFDLLSEKVFPSIVKDRGPDETIRIWVAACATGKEVYSIAIQLLEYLERTQRSFPIQIFGTDVSERSIETARAARFPQTISATVSAERLSRFFTKIEGGYQVARPARDLCIFSRHDLTKDPPLAKMDLISCRNLLIYLGPILQRRVLSIFAYSLRPPACLLLGSSESIGSLGDHFIPVDQKRKIYCRNLALARPPFELPSGSQAHDPAAASPSATKADRITLLDREVDRFILNRYSPSGFVVNERFEVIKFRGEVGPYLSPPPGDPELDLFRMVREDMAPSLRSALDEARAMDCEVRRDGIQIRGSSGFREINLVIWPVEEPGRERLFLVLFEEPGAGKHKLSQQMSPAPANELEREYQNMARELAATRSYMQRLVEELRSANEEAQSSNEELQSTNEELQTAKEELQSTNEELTTTNEEMEGRNTELAQLNNDLANLLSSMETPIVMLDRELRIRRYTPAAETVLSLIPTDIGRPISDLKLRLDAPDLENLLEGVARSGNPATREAQHESGRWYSLRINAYKAAREHLNGAVLQLLDIEQQKIAMEEIKQARDYAEAIIETIREPLLVLDGRLCVQSANRAFLETFRLGSEQVLDRSIYNLDEGRWNVPRLTRLLENLLHDGHPVLSDVELESELKHLGSRVFQINGRHLKRDREHGSILLAIDDITDRKRMAEAKYRRLFETAQDGIVIIDAETGEITDLNPFVIQMLGISRSDLAGKRFWEVEPLSFVPNGRSALNRLRREKVVRFPEVVLKTGAGDREIVVEVVANLYQEGSREVAQFNIRDITDRKRFDEQLRQTARLESLGILAGGIAHDFNNLLAGILGNAGLALGDAAPGTPYQRSLKNVVQASQRAAELTRQMLAYAGKGRLDVRTMDLSGLVKEISSLLESSIPRSVELKLDLGAEPLWVEADAGQLQQVVMNLVINAAESVGEDRQG